MYFKRYRKIIVAFMICRNKHFRFISLYSFFTAYYCIKLFAFNVELNVIEFRILRYAVDGYRGYKIVSVGGRTARSL